MGCSRCGSEGHTEYGPDGQSYCSSCIFYGMNKPCWKCRMYLPSSELQMYRGQLTCQYCLMDLRDAERAVEKREHGAPPAAKAEGHEHIDYLAEEERCDRCRRKLSIVYILNDRKLCEVCLEQEKDEWEKKSGGAKPMIMKFRIKGNEGLLVRIMRKLEIALGNVIRGRKKGAAGGSVVPAEKSGPQGAPDKKKEKKDRDLEFEKHFHDDSGEDSGKGK